jgi:copper resistance protein C
MKLLASFGVVALMATLLLLRPATVSAHSEYDRSEPADGATVAAAPATVKVWFTETVQLSGSSLKVTNAAGQQVDNKDVKLDPSDADRKILVVSLNSGLPAGTYKVAWTSTSADDGDEDEGDFSFKIGAAASSPATASSPVTAAPSPVAAQAPARPAAAPSPAAAPAQAPVRPAASPSPQTPGSLPRTGIAEPTTPVPWLVFGGLLLVVGAAVMRRARAS